MLFNSSNFLVFIGFVLIFYFLTPYKFRGILLLLASLFFYSVWKFDYIFILLSCILINYFGSIKIATTKDPFARKYWLILTLSFNLLFLFFFKYIGFVVENLNILFSAFNKDSKLSAPDIILPIGISFFTLQAIAYSIDVYNKKVKYEPNIFKFALFISFFPQLLAGPIERAAKLIPQFTFKLNPNGDQIYLAVKRVLWGFFKKIVIADNLSFFVDNIYNNPSNHNGLSLLIATYFFAIQIYCDFSGYVDIAIGIAKFFSIDLSENFQFPYKATNIREFWQRWHITLSNWFRDYVYIPLGGSRVKEVKFVFNIIFVFCLSGLWHGANWTFLIWGLLNAFYYLSHYYFTKLNLRIKTLYFNSYKNYLKRFITFNLICFSWVFFKANNVNDAGLIISKITNDLINFSFLYGDVFENFIKIISEMYGLKFFIILILLGFFLLVDNFNIINRYMNIFNNKFQYFTDILISDFIIISIIFFSEEGSNPFIYFQF